MTCAFSPESENHLKMERMRVMSWQKITLPYNPEIDPRVVEIGNLAKDCYERENRPAGFGMLHAARFNTDGLNDTRIVYLSPVAAELCGEIRERYTLEPCEVPYRDEPDIKWVFGDPLVMGYLRSNYQLGPGESLLAVTAGLVS
jgi:hypothetical protein